jgi:hypothetical protein
MVPLKAGVVPVMKRLAETAIVANPVVTSQAILPEFAQNLQNDVLRGDWVGVKRLSQTPIARCGTSTRNATAL